MTTEEKQLLSSILTKLNEMTFSNKRDIESLKYSNPYITAEIEIQKQNVAELIEQFKNA